MKTSLVRLFFSLLIVTQLRAQSNQLFTCVPIAQSGLRLVFCENFFDATNELGLLDQREINYDAPMTWMLHNPSSNRFATLIFLGMTNSFDFRLLNADGSEVAKTKMGEKMSSGPKSLTDIFGNPYVRRIDAGARDFPMFSEIFNSPPNGIYIFELKYWVWDAINEKFILSDPVRLRVIKKTVKL